jgi:hypothetical protein
MRCGWCRVAVVSPADMTTLLRRPRVRADLVVLGIEAALVGAAVAVGALLNHWRVPIHADAAPLYGAWLPHVGPGTPLAIGVAEVERIWLPYAIWLLAATAWLPAGHRRGWLVAQALTALLVNHLLLTGW